MLAARKYSFRNFEFLVFKVYIYNSLVVFINLVMRIILFFNNLIAVYQYVCLYGVIQLYSGV